MALYTRIDEASGQPVTYTNINGVEYRVVQPGEQGYNSNGAPQGAMGQANITGGGQYGQAQAWLDKDGNVIKQNDWQNNPNGGSYLGDIGRFAALSAAGYGAAAGLGGMLGGMGAGGGLGGSLVEGSDLGGGLLGSSGSQGTLAGTVGGSAGAGAGGSSIWSGITPSTMLGGANAINAGLGTLGNIMTASNTNDLMKDITDKSDPFASQRAQYQGLLNQSYTDPKYYDLGGSSALSRLVDTNQKATQAKLASQGYNMSGNTPLEMMKTGVNTSSNYVLQDQQNLANLAGAQFNPAASAPTLANLNQQGNNSWNQAAVAGGSLIDQLWGKPKGQNSGPWTSDGGSSNTYIGEGSWYD